VLSAPVAPLLASGATCNSKFQPTPLGVGVCGSPAPYRRYFPRKELQLGQLCSLSMQSSMQQGMRQQPIQHPKRAMSAPEIQAIMEGLVLTVDSISAWQWGQIMWVGLGPGGTTVVTTGTCTCCGATAGHTVQVKVRSRDGCASAGQQQDAQVNAVRVKQRQSSTSSFCSK